MTNQLYTASDLAEMTDDELRIVIGSLLGYKDMTEPLYDIECTLPNGTRALLGQWPRRMDSALFLIGENMQVRTINMGKNKWRAEVMHYGSSYFGPIADAANPARATSEAWVLWKQEQWTTISG